MTYKEIIKQTETLSQQDFLNYLNRLPEIAQKKFSLDIFNIFLHNFGKQKNDLLKIEKENKTNSGISNLLKYAGILEGIDTSDISEEELYLQGD